MSAIRVGVIGLGVGEQHLRGYLLNPNCEVAAICDHNSAKLDRVREYGPRVHATTNSEEILDDPDIDLVSIASYDEYHFTQVCRALDHGKHVFVEKPLCQTQEQLATIKQKWAAHGGRIKIKSNFVLRRAPVYQAIRAQIQSGYFGSIFAFDGDYLFGRLSKITRGWRSNTVGYSVMSAGGIHLVDLMVWMTGDRPTHVTSIGNRLCTTGSRFRYDDFTAATLSFPSGMIGRITANFGCVHGHQHVVRIFGTQRTFLYDDQGPRVQMHRDPAPPAEALDLAALPASKYVLIDDFIELIRGDGSVIDDASIDFDVMSICISCDESLRSGTTIEISYA